MGEDYKMGDGWFEECILCGEEVFDICQNCAMCVDCCDCDIFE